MGPTAWAGQVSQGGCFLVDITVDIILHFEATAQAGMGPGHGTSLCLATHTDIHCLLHGHGQQVKASIIWQSPAQGGCPVICSPAFYSHRNRQGQDQTMTHPHLLSPQPLSQRLLQLLTKPKGKNVHRAPVCTTPCFHRQLEAPHSHRQGGTSL